MSTDTLSCVLDLTRLACTGQMLVVSDPISSEAQLANSDGSMGKLNIEDFIWPHGITPPLRHVRKRRFRKRISRRVRYLSWDDAPPPCYV